jgi:hypothetical protein
MIDLKVTVVSVAKVPADIVTLAPEAAESSTTMFAEAFSVVVTVAAPAVVVLVVVVMVVVGVTAAPRPPPPPQPASMSARQTTAAEIPWVFLIRSHPLVLFGKRCNNFMSD